MQVFTGLQLNHETGLLSLEASRSDVCRAPKMSHRRSFGPRGGRVWPVVAQKCRWVAALFPLLHGHLGFLPRMHLEGHVVATASRVVAAISRMLRLQAGVLKRLRFSAEDFISARRSVQLESEESAKLSGLELKMRTKVVGWTCTRRWWEAFRQTFSQCLSIALPSTTCHPPSFSRSLPGTFCLAVLEKVAGDLTGRGQSLCHGIASRVSFW